MARTVLDVAQHSCTTGDVAGLTKQLVAEINQLKPNALVKCDELIHKSSSFNGTTAYLQPAAKAALKKVVDDRGSKPTVNSAYRTVVQQWIVKQWQLNNHRCSVTHAAAPGSG